MEGKIQVDDEGVKRVDIERKDALSFVRAGNEVEQSEKKKPEGGTNDTKH